jgi:hypothetical protein
MEVSGQLHTPAEKPPRKYYISGKAVNTRVKMLEIEFNNTHMNKVLNLRIHAQLLSNSQLLMDSQLHQLVYIRNIQVCN